jgi:hypothetical protein
MKSVEKYVRLMIQMHQVILSLIIVDGKFQYEHIGRVGKFQNVHPFGHGTHLTWRSKKRRIEESVVKSMLLMSSP